MFLPREVTETLIKGTGERFRYTQDSPVLPEVWIQYGLSPLEPVELLLTPHRRSSAGQLAARLRTRLADDRKKRPNRPGGRGKRERIPIAYTKSHVATSLMFDELVRTLLPMTRWWHAYVWQPTREHLFPRDDGHDPEAAIDDLFTDGSRAIFTRALDALRADTIDGLERDGALPRLPHDLLWMMRIVGAIAWLQKACAEDDEGARLREAAKLPSERDMVDAIADLMTDPLRPKAEDRQVLWQVNRDRQVELAIVKSRCAVKADAAQQVFDLDHSRLRWAVIDNGIDAFHPAFCPPGDAPRAARTRVVGTYDFTRLKPLLDPANLRPNSRGLPAPLRALMRRDDDRARQLKKDLKELEAHLKRGREIDWGLLAPFLEIPHDDGYVDPPGDHGTHVAGILGADWREPDPDPPGVPSKVVMQGMCPDIRLYDLRVLDAKGRGDEFGVLAALQFVQHLNGQRDFLTVHGANLSLSLRHEVANYACGRTPVCEEAERLTASGVVVVAAAGNVGYLKYRTANGTIEGYQASSITDPGNAEAVITVGATHRYRPHSYGVSYFSSRGPTGDGRIKPDLVAPGEKVNAPTPGGDHARKDGTSMAAPHVSGAAAALMARYKELVGRPTRIKQILCDTATDLGRERYFQGAGMVDILRALQSV